MRTIRSLAVVALAVLAGCSTLPPGTKRDDRDPLERVNRTVYKFNDAVVRDVGRPVAKGWTAVTPGFVRRAIANVFANAMTPDIMLNDLLQGRFKDAGSDFARLAINTTFGVGGLIDVATPGGVRKNDNDFGRTLGTWGVPGGPYLMLPLLGPSTVRDLAGRVADGFANPQNYIQDTAAFYGTYGLMIVNELTEAILPTYDLLDQQHPYDPYGFMRNAYLQRRDYQIHGEHQSLDQGGLDQEELELQQDATDDAGAAPAPKQ